MSTERNIELCQLYADGWTLGALATRYVLSRQRTRQIIRAAGIWKRPAVRPIFLGVDVTQETKNKLKAEAERQQTSMSRLASDAIVTMLEKEPTHEDPS
jgi:hypothetical protein